MSRTLTEADLKQGGHFTIDEEVFLSSERLPEIPDNCEHFEEWRVITIRKDSRGLFDVIFAAKHQSFHCGVLTVAPEQLIGIKIR